MRVLVTGGAGFIGTNLVSHLLDAGHNVTVYDNLSRRGVRRNLSWLQAKDPLGSKLPTISADVRDRLALTAAAEGMDAIFHLAAQVADKISCRSSW